MSAPFAFVDADPARAALDRADHLRNDPDALAALWPDARVLLLDERGNAAATDGGDLDAPAGAALTGGAGGVGAATFLGLDGDGRAWFALDAALAAHVATRTLDLRAAAATWPSLHAAAFAQARAMQAWRARHRYCGACGGALSPVRAGWAMRCTQCGSEHYPRTDPAVIVAASDGERLLLGRQPSWPARRWSVIAGFVEPGETLEQTVVREVGEETGVRVTRVRYLGSQPWPFPGALMLGFAADAEPDAPRASDELEAVRWFTLDDVRDAWTRDAAGAHDDGDGPLLSPRISIARWLIGHWLRGRGVDPDSLDTAR